ncbi:MAG TPA: 2-phosphosulfolactate phosphatase [Gemmatimonadaceae bacterium]|nr:2-phosphosulfolactate phosphatase [Gemmatimonadaceae bacterium]
MRIDVFFGPAGLTASDVTGRVVVVIDVLRASTSIATALANGARAVIPVESTEDVVTRAKAFERSEVKLAGERQMRPIPGFDLGNSPREFSREVVEGKTVLLSTTNGTTAIASLQGPRDVVIGSYVNFSAVLAMLRAALRGGTDIAILCAGREKQFSLEDAACAGRFVHHAMRRRTDVAVNDAAFASMLIDRRYSDNLMRLFSASAHGRALSEAGYGDDLADCAAIDSYPIIPIYQDRQITKLGPERER